MSHGKGAVVRATSFVPFHYVLPKLLTMNEVSVFLSYCFTVMCWSYVLEYIKSKKSINIGLIGVM